MSGWLPSEPPPDPDLLEECDCCHDLEPIRLTLFDGIQFLCVRASAAWKKTIDTGDIRRLVADVMHENEVIENGVRLQVLNAGNGSSEIRQVIRKTDPEPVAAEPATDLEPADPPEVVSESEVDYEME